MAGWSMLTNGGTLDCSNSSFRGNKGSPSCSHNGNVESEVKLRCLFDQVLSIFNNEAVGLGCFRPMPVLISNGKSLDLFKLFQAVIRRGGFDLVDGFWIFVVKELGLDFDANSSTAVKLVYYKYLYGLERWLRGTGRDGRLRASGNFGCLSLELETEFRSLLSNENGPKKNNVNGNDSRPGPVIVNIDSDDDENFHDCKKNSSDDDNDDDVVILDDRIGKEIFESRKRKRESLSGMLNWVIEIAKCPIDISIGKIPPFYKWRDHIGDELWAQAIRARDVLLQSNERSLLQTCQNSKKLDVSPVVDHSTDRSRFSGRLSALTKHQSSNSCSSLSSQVQLINSPKKKLEISPKKKLEIFRAYVMVGRRFQAEVPKWNAIVHESDSKWLGTKMWPLDNKHNNAEIKTSCIGKGRPNTCECHLPGSVECVRFHIAEKRTKLKLELGSAFYRWRFDRMGEEISLRWTPQEKIKFKDIVRLNAQSLDASFWDDTRRYFSRKTREELVSYYFNVFIVQRRSYQNRVTPKHVDSDDDESELGCLSDVYGPAKFRSSDISICLENKQFIDFR